MGLVKRSLLDEIQLSRSPRAADHLKSFGPQDIGVLAAALDALAQDAKNKAAEVAEAAERRASAERSLSRAREALDAATDQAAGARPAARVPHVTAREAQQAADAQAHAEAVVAAVWREVEQAERNCAASSVALGKVTAEHDRLARTGEALALLVRDGRTARTAPAPKPLPDTDGFDLRPDPLKARTAAELVDALRSYRVWAGEPPFRQMAARARQKVAHSTLYAAMDSDELPRQDVVAAIIAGCGGSEDEQRRYVTAWRRIKFGTAEPEPVAGTPALRALSAAAS